jgi:hypothetical protein
MKTTILILFLFLFFCKEKEFTNDVYQGKYKYNKSIIDTFSVKILELPNDSIYYLKNKIDRFSNIETNNKKKYFINGFKKHEFSNKKDSIYFLGYNKLKSNFYFFMEKNEYITCLYIAINNGIKTIFLPIEYNQVDSEFQRYHKISDNYILVKEVIDHSYDIIDEDNPPELEHIKYAIIEIKDNDFHILEFEESEKILFEKFKEEDVQKYRKQ